MSNNKGFTPTPNEDTRIHKEFAEVNSSNKNSLDFKNSVRNSNSNSKINPHLVWGFTIIETILIVGILAIIFGMGFPIAVDSYRSYQFRAERDQFVSLLEIARNLSMINLNQSPHGVFQNSNNFIVFEGNSFAGRNQNQDQTFSRSKSISISGPSEIVFNAVSGQATSSTYVFDNGKISSNVYVNKEGQIDWQ